MNLLYVIIKETTHKIGLLYDSRDTEFRIVVTPAGGRENDLPEGSIKEWWVQTTLGARTGKNHLTVQLHI